MGDELLGVVHHGRPDATLGVLVVVGGPQYRVGSHRQFVVMARSLVQAGIPVMRFDCRGMGDSEGSFESFESLGPDIEAAIREFRSRVPTIKKLVLLGLCDAASAISLCCNDLQNVAGLILLNPWVRSIGSEAEAYVKHYYARRIWQKSFWRKVFSCQFDFAQSVRDFWRALTTYSRHMGKTDADGARSQPKYVEDMLQSLRKYCGNVLVVLSANDLTANEFRDLTAADPNWKGLLERKNFVKMSFPGADHTLSERRDLDAVTGAIKDWLRETVIR